MVASQLDHFLLLVLVGLNVDVALDFLLVLVLLCSYRYSVLLVLVLFVDDDLYYVSSVSTDVYDLSFVDCCRIDPLSLIYQEAKRFLFEIMVVILWLDGVCQISPLSFLFELVLLLVLLCTGLV